MDVRGKIIFQEQITIAFDNHQQVVEIVNQTTRELSHDFMFLIATETFSNTVSATMSSALSQEPKELQN